MAEDNQKYMPMPPIVQSSAAKDVVAAKSGDASKLSKPTRPLTAYHLFFQLEREYILQTTPAREGEVHEDQVDTRSVGKDIDEEMPSRYQPIHYNEDWHKSGSGKRGSKNAPKRKHRKTHGKIGFLELSSVISKRWHQLEELDSQTKSYVTKIASQLLEVYKREMSAFKAQSMAVNGTTFFTGMQMSFEPLPKMTYPPPPTGTFTNVPMVHYPPIFPRNIEFDANTYAAKKPSPSTFDVDVDQLLQEDPISFKAEQPKPVDVDQLLQEDPISFKGFKKEQCTEETEDPLMSGFTFHPVSTQAFKRRKSTVSEDRHISKRSRHSSSNGRKLTKRDIEFEKYKLKRKIRAMREKMKNAGMSDKRKSDDNFQYDYHSVRSIMEDEIESFLSRHFETGGRQISRNEREQEDEARRNIPSPAFAAESRNTPPPAEFDACPAPHAVSPSLDPENESKMMSSIDEDDLMIALQGSELFA